MRTGYTLLTINITAISFYVQLKQEYAKSAEQIYQLNAYTLRGYLPSLS